MRNADMHYSPGPELDDTDSTTQTIMNARTTTTRHQRISHPSRLAGWASRRRIVHPLRPSRTRRNRVHDRRPLTRRHCVRSTILGGANRCLALSVACHRPRCGGRARIADHRRRGRRYTRRRELLSLEVRTNRPALARDSGHSATNATHECTMTTDHEGRQRRRLTATATDLDVVKTKGVSHQRRFWQASISATSHDRWRSWSS